MAKMLLAVSSMILVGMCSIPSTMYADDITTFELSTAPGYSTYGNITIDTTTGTITAIDLNFTGEPASVDPADPTWDIYGTAPDAHVEIDEVWNDLQTGYYFSATIDLPVSTLVGYMGGDICTKTAPCADGAYSGYVLGIGSHPYTSGNLVSAPEPASLIFLGTGLLALAGFVRYRSFLAKRRLLLLPLRVQI